MSKNCSNSLILLVVCTFPLALYSASLLAQVIPVTIDKVEPANWQPGHSAEVKLCFSGQHLDSVVAVAVKHKGVRVLRVESPDASHLFVLLRISADAVPGMMMLQVSTRFMTTFAAVPMLGEHLPGQLSASQ
ncbi:MAG: cyclomaltodextrinase N-terminal domain-containing protein [Terracidiphilus sp.]